MQRKSNRISRFGIIVGTVLLAAGCHPPPRAGTPPRPYDGVLLRVACPGTAARTLVTQYGSPWFARTQARLEIVSYSPGQDPPADADVWLLRPAEMPRFAAAGKLAAVPTDCTAEQGTFAWQSLLPLYANKLLMWDGTAYALPVLGNAPVCFYRSDLFDDPKNQAAFQAQYARKLGPPETWRQFAEIAEFFKNQGANGAAVPSLPPLPLDDGALEREFYAIAAPLVRRAIGDEDAGERPSDQEVFSFHYDMKSGQPRIAAAGFVAALQLLRRLQPCRPAQPAAEPAQAFAEGHAVLCLADASWVGRFEASTHTRDKFGICRVPGSDRTFGFATDDEQPTAAVNYVPYLGAGGWLGVVPRSSPHVDAAFALLAELGGPALSRQLVFEPRFGGGAFRHDHLSTVTGWYAFGLDAKQTARLVEAVRQSLAHSGIINPVVQLRTPDQREHSLALVAGLRAALDGKAKSEKETLTDVRARWDALDANRDSQTRKADYLLSLSLRAEP
jgi:multiple sugar transport system substrate-binding protein